MLIIFQNKIIYMPSFPPSSRRDLISDYEKKCGGVKWKLARMKSLDGIELALCIASTRGRQDKEDEDHVPIYVLYFQGNCSSTPPRLPLISPIVKALDEEHRRYVFVCVSYRGYWTSQGRANEIGITKDALAALEWISSQHPFIATSAKIPVVIWGQSIGCGVASTLAANHIEKDSSVEIVALVLEAPFTNVRDMMKAIYPQKWLPYQYLWPFLRNRLDSMAAMEKMVEKARKPRITLVVAGEDELVPSHLGDTLEQKGNKLGLDIRKVVVPNSFHEQILEKSAGRVAVVDGIRNASQYS